MRVVLDTVIFVRSLINPYGPCASIVFSRSGDYQLFVSEPVLTEILQVLERPALVRKYRAPAGRDPARVLQILGEALVVTVADIPSVSRDPKDDKFLATALAASADYLVSEDFDLLDLGEYQGIPILTCRVFHGVLQAERPAR